MSSISERYDMDEVHERILQDAQALQRVPSVDMAEMFNVASKAYLDSRGAVDRMGDAQQRAMSALEASGTDSMAMFRRADQDFGEDSSQVRKREFAFEFIFAAIVPGMALASAFLLMGRDAHAALAVYLGVGAVLAAATCFALFGAVKGRRVPRFASWSSVLVHSGGSIAAGLVMFLGIGYVGHRSSERDIREATVSGLERVNQAAVVTLAARMAGADSDATQAALTRSTDSDWIKVKASPSSPGPVFVSAELSRKSTAELRLARSASGADGLASFVTDTSGTAVHYANYFTGTVLKADLKEITLAVSPTRNRVVPLPSGSLPPSVNSEVAVAVGANGEGTLLVQPIDSVVAALRTSAHN